MKRMIKHKWIGILLLLVSLLLFAGCSFTQSKEDFLAEKNLTACVYYHANGGKFENNSVRKEMWYPEGQRALNINVDTVKGTPLTVSYTNYNFNGWYLVEVDEDGNPICDENGKAVLGEKMDFSKPLQKGDIVHVAAGWLAKVKVNVQMVCEIGESIVGTDGTSYENGAQLTPFNYDTKGLVQATSASRFDFDDKSYTFVGYYADEACKQSVAWPLQQGEEDQTVYARYLTGVWTLVDDADGVKKMFANTGFNITTFQTYKYFITKDIDCSSISVAPISALTCTIDGNGCTLSGLTVTKSSALTSNSKTSLFGEIGSGAVLKDLTFEKLNMSYEVRPNATIVNIFFAFTAIAADATVENIYLDGSLSVELGSESAIVDNLEGDMTWWKFGGYLDENGYFLPYGSDADYTAGGIVVSDGWTPVITYKD